MRQSVDSNTEKVRHDELPRPAKDSENVAESMRDFERLSGMGDSFGWRFDRDEIHDRT
jgi:hypothetical protein